MKKNTMRNLVLPEMSLANSKTQYKPYFSTLPKKNKENAEYISPLGYLQIHQAQNIIEEDVEILAKLKIKVGKLCEKLNEKCVEQWSLYLNKSEIYSAKNFEWIQLEEFLLKMILQLAQNCHHSVEELQNAKEQNQFHEKTCLTNLNPLSTISKANFCEKFNKSHNLNLINESILNQTSLKTMTKLKEPLKSHPNKKDKVQINLLTCQISKLEKQASLFQQRLLENEANYNKKIIALEEQINKTNKYKYMEILQQKMKFESQMESKKAHNQTLIRQIRQCRVKYDEMQNKLNESLSISESIKIQNEVLKKFKRYKELWLMENQQILHCREKISQLNEEKETLTKNNAGLKQKLKEISKNFNYNYSVVTQTQKTKQDLNEILKQFRDWLQFIAVPRVTSGMVTVNTFFPEMTAPKNSQEYNNLLPKDDLTNYKLLRPNFFIYFQAFENIIITQKKFPQRKSMPPDFYLTIRAIMDAMYVHFTFNENYKQWLSFPEFVSGFIQKFEINFETRKPNLRKSPCHSEQKINFLLNVFNTQAANTWQCEMFRSFLLQEFTLDEIYFYLDCRFNLFKGSQVNNNWGSSDSLTFVKVSVAQDVVEEKLKSYEKDMSMKLKKFIKMKKRNKNGKEFIDSNFVLKLLMEVYSIQKVKSEKFFHHNFRLKLPGNKISYAEYYSFMEKNFPFLLSQDIASLFRQTYGIALGNITYKTIHYICSTKGLFIPLIREKMLKKSKAVGKQKRQFNDILFIDLQNCISSLSTDIQQIGLQQLLGLQVKMNQLLRESENFRSLKTIYQSQIFRQTHKILKIKTILSWKNTNSTRFDDLSRDDLRDFVSHLLSIAHHGDHYVAGRKRRKEKREKAVELLTHNFKIRIQQSLREFNVSNQNQFELKLKNQELENDELKE